MTKEEIFYQLYDKEIAAVWQAFQDIEKSIDQSDFLYQHFDDVQKMLVNEKSFIKMRGFRLICKLSRWDKNNRIEPIIDNLLAVLDDDKPTIVRQCLSALPTLLFYKPQLAQKISHKVKNLNLSKYKDTMRPLIEKDCQQITLLTESSPAKFF